MEFESIKIIEKELGFVDEELELQGEKFMSIQKKLGISSQILERNRTLLQKLKAATQMRKIFNFIGLILLVFMTFLIAVKYEKVIKELKVMFYKIQNKK